MHIFVKSALSNQLPYKIKYKKIPSYNHKETYNLKKKQTYKKCLWV